MMKKQLFASLTALSLLMQGPILAADKPLVSANDDPNCPGTDAEHHCSGFRGYGYHPKDYFVIPGLPNGQDMIIEAGQKMCLDSYPKEHGNTHTCTTTPNEVGRKLDLDEWSTQTKKANDLLLNIDGKMSGRRSWLTNAVESMDSNLKGDVVFSPASYAQDLKKNTIITEKMKQALIDLYTIKYNKKKKSNPNLITAETPTTPKTETPTTPKTETPTTPKTETPTTPKTETPTTPKTETPTTPKTETPTTPKTETPTTPKTETPTTPKTETPTTPKTETPSKKPTKIKTLPHTGASID